MSASAAATRAVETGLKKRRSILTNDPRRLPGADMRSSAARRFKDIVEAMLVEFGAEADTSRVRELASLKLTLEATQAAVLGGDQAQCDELVRLSNIIARRERDLRLRQKPKRLPTLLEKLIATKNAEAAAK